MLVGPDGPVMRESIPCFGPPRMAAGSSLGCIVLGRFTGKGWPKLLHFLQTEKLLLPSTVIPSSAKYIFEDIEGVQTTEIFDVQSVVIQ